MLSQPTRTILWFCLINAIPHEFHEVNLAAGEQKSEEFTKLYVRIINFVFYNFI